MKTKERQLFSYMAFKYGSLFHYNKDLKTGNGDIVINYKDGHYEHFVVDRALVVDKKSLMILILLYIS